MRPSGFEGIQSVPPGRSAPTAPHSAIAEAWGRLEREIRECRRCSLHETRTNVVIYRGSHSPRVVFVGEAPGATEDRTGIPFTGRSGQRLDAAIDSVGLRPEEFGVLNLVKCRPPGNRFDPGAARTCRPHLDHQLEILRPSVLVSLGAHALRALDPEAPRILLAAGHPRRSGGRDLFPLVHPAAALRSRALAARWRLDLAALTEWLGRS
jgi:uracil-DNA glycosylase